MKSLVLLSIFCFLAFVGVGQCSSMMDATVDVRIDGFRNNNGHVAIQLILDGEVVSEKMEVITEGKLEVVFSGLNEGVYQLKYFHDENDNVELDTNFIGIPKEGYGFSNNAKGTFGPPKDEETFFEVKRKGAKQELQVHYL